MIQQTQSKTEELYLDLLKRSLTNTVFADEPDANNEDTATYVHNSIMHYQRSSAVSMVPLARLDHLEQCMRTVLAERVPGDLVETGVWRGGTVIFMRAVLQVLGDEERRVWAADSFEGLPEPDQDLYPAEYKAFHSAAMTKYYDRLAVSLDEVQRNFRAYKMLDERVKFLKGWFKDTLPTAPIERLAIMRLDGDYYESTRDSLTNLYGRLSIGGYVIIDDYGEDSWTYCRQAVDEFRKEHAIEDPLQQVDKPCFFWRKSR